MSQGHPISLCSPIPYKSHRILWARLLLSQNRACTRRKRTLSHRTYRWLQCACFHCQWLGKLYCFRHRILVSFPGDHCTHTSTLVIPFTVSLIPQPGGLLTGMTQQSIKDALPTSAHLALLLISTLAVVTTTRRATRTTREWRHAWLSTIAAPLTPSGATVATMPTAVMSLKNVSHCTRALYSKQVQRRTILTLYCNISKFYTHMVLYISILTEWNYKYVVQCTYVNTVSQHGRVMVHTILQGCMCMHVEANEDRKVE